MVRDGWWSSSVAGVLAAAALLVGCAGNPTSSSQAVVPAPAQPTLQEWMEQAQAAQTGGQRERARQAWRSAAKAYPTQKSPWQRLAEDYFETSDYGNAILAAQEVLQRDNQDTLAHSVLAVSGLRLSTVSLTALRDRGNYPVGSREEALGLTRAMREALGETTLVPTRPDTPARAAATNVPPAAAKATAPAPATQPKAAVPLPVRAAVPAAVATPAVNTVPAAAARSTNGGTVVPVAAPATARPAPPAPKPAAAPAPAPKPATADPFKLLN